jgi:hypothetical protein
VHTGDRRRRTNAGIAERLLRVEGIVRVCRHFSFWCFRTLEHWGWPEPLAGASRHETLLHISDSECAGNLAFGTKQEAR